MKSFAATVRDLLGTNDSVDVSTETLREMGFDLIEFSRECEAMNHDSSGEFTFEKVRVNPCYPEDFTTRITKRKITSSDRKMC